MQKQFLNFRKVFTNIAFSPLILISNNSELAAKYLPNDFEQKFINSEINNNTVVYFKDFTLIRRKISLSQKIMTILRKRVFLFQK